MKAMQKLFLLFALVGLAASFTGCAYMEDRFYDATDLVNAKVMAGDGADVSARALWFAVAVGESESYNVGYANRDYGTFKSHRVDLAFVLPFINREDVSETLSGDIKTYGVGDQGLVEEWKGGSPTIQFDKYFATETYESYLRVGVTVQLFLGVDLEVRPVEALDLLLGFLTIDIRDDDQASYSDKNPTPEK